MKSIIKIATCIFLTGIMGFVSCKKETSCEGCAEKNKPPIAIAGPDQVITLPADSISLDGSASSDPDGKISKWLWSKISGPASFNIVKATDSVTKVKTLVVGTYLFELIVTDNGGLSARDTLKVIVDYVETPNHPPVANAGADQTITLPTNSVNLDGSGSIDPDNNITNYLWTKILGPSSFNILNANAVQTQIINLLQGIYQFELKVTDAAGLFSKDTMQVAVIGHPPPSICDNSNRPLVNAQLIPAGTLSIARGGMAVASAANKIVFAGGGDGSSSGGGYGFSSRVDIYDLTTQTCATAELNVARWNIAAVAAGNKIFFGGGEHGDGTQPVNTVDIYDVSTNTWSVDALSEEGDYIAAAAVGNKVFFAGGDGGVLSDRFDKVDIYDLSTNTWSATLLSEPRTQLSAVKVDNKIYFAGGYNPFAQNVSNRIDIYDNLTSSWSISSLAEPKRLFAAVAIENKIYWSGGFNSGSTTSCSVEIKDVNTWNSSIDFLSTPGVWVNDAGNNTVIKDNKIVFLRSPWNTNINTNTNNKFDIYDITTNTWSIGVLPVSIWGASIISVNNTIYVAGGVVNGVLSKQVWKLEF